MNTTDNTLLIASAPPEVLLFIGAFFCVAALVLFALSIEAGHYPGLRRWLQRMRRVGLPWRRRWLFIPNARAAIAAGG